MTTTRDAVDDLSIPEITQILLDGYGIVPDSIEFMNGEIATVCRVITQHSTLAIKALPGSPDDGQLVRWQAEAMQLLASHKLPVPAITRSLSDDLVYESQVGDRPVYTVVSDWLSDPALMDVQPDDGLFTQVGALAAHVNLALRNATPAPLSVSHEWEFARTMETLQLFMQRVTDEPVLAVAHQVLDLFRSQVSPVIDSLPRGVLHQDLHDSNLLIGVNAEGNQSITGILDFGDMVEGPRVAELIVAAAYVARNATEPEQAIHEVVAGWQSVQELTADELSIITIGAISRLTLNATIWSARAFGPRGEYARARSQGALTTIDALLQALAD